MSWCSRTVSTSWRPIECTGFSDVIGSWKIIAISLPRSLRRRAGGTFSRSSSLNSTSPVEVVLRGVVEPHDREARHALAGARLADDADGLPALDLEVDAVDGLHDPVVGLEVRAQVADVE